MAADDGGTPSSARTKLAGAHVIVLDSDAHASAAVTRALEQAGYQSSSAADASAACALARRLSARAILADVASLHRGVAEFLQRVRVAAPSTAIVLTGADVTAANALRWLRDGATDVLLKPFDEHTLHEVVGYAVQRMSMATRESKTNAASLDALDAVVGRDQGLRRALELARKASAVRSTVLIHGESGTGKSMLARAIHGASERAAAPFVELACGSIPESLLESELFGHVKGAFTGALADKKGRFLAADGGTIFLDEINSASPSMQLKLLRVLQEKRFEPVGSDATTHIDVRVIVASNQPLEALVEDGRFRQDLFYRVHVLPIELPPLRERPSDVDSLAAHFLGAKCIDLNRTILGFTAAATELLRAYHWPGNVRELENAIERAAIVCEDAWIDAHHLPQRLARLAPAKEADVSLPPADSRHAVQPLSVRPSTSAAGKLTDALRDPECAAILAALDANGWNRGRTAMVLGIDRTTLYRKMRDLGLGGARNAG